MEKASATTSTSSSSSGISTAISRDRKKGKNARRDSAPVNAISVLVRLPPGHTHNQPSPVYVVAPSPTQTHSPHHSGPSSDHPTAPFFFTSRMVTGSRPHSTDLTATKHPSHPTPPTPFQIHAPPSNPIPVSTPPRRKSTSFHPYDMVHTRLPAPATHSMSCSVPNSATFANRELDAAYPGPSNASYPVSRNAEDALMDYLFDPETPASRSGSGSGTSGSLPTEVRNRIPEWQEQLNSLFLQSMNVKSRIL